MPNIDLTSLDFDSRKQSLINFLKTQTQFRDYDFEGSNMNVLLDLLAYNSSLDNFYRSMIFSEMFNDTAQLRDSVISKAKDLNYVPYSKRSAKAIVEVIFQTNGIFGTFEIPKGTQFSGQNANGSFIFTTDENKVLYSSNSTFITSNLSIYEGSYINETFIIDNNIENQRFVLSNKNIDTSSLQVTVVENNGQSNTDFIQAKSLYNLNSNSAVYFLQAAQKELYEIMFGDGVFGRLPQNGSTVLTTYRICSGSDANGVRAISIDQNLGSYNGGTLSNSVNVIFPSENGSNNESIESIRFRSPRHYQTQESAIVKNDYINIIKENFPEIKTVNVFGGDETNKVQFGRIFISAITNSGYNLTDQRKTDIIDFLKDKVTLSLQPKIIDPEFLYISPTINIDADFSSTNLSPSELESKALADIIDYNTKYLQDFNVVFYKSIFSQLLNNVDTSVKGNENEIVMRKNVTPSLNIEQNILISFYNEIIPGTINSSNFILNDGKLYSFVDYNPNNDTFKRNLDIKNNFSVVNTNNVLYLKDVSNNQNYKNIGTIDYKTGTISVNKITLVDFVDGIGISFFSTSKDKNIYANKNNLLELDLENISITVKDVNIK